jgi:ribosomal-protein-alanine N-acetyltransferase
MRRSPAAAPAAAVAREPAPPTVPSHAPSPRPALGRATRVAIRAVSAADEPAYLAAVRRSARLHRPWVSAPADADAFGRYLARFEPPAHHGFVVHRVPSGELVGAIHLTHVVHGALCSGYLGYYAFAGHERQGHMREGLQLVIRHAFRRLGLHRLEANIQPGNTASIALARACGLQREGFSPAYLKIGGRWRDHERWAIVRR